VVMSPVPKSSLKAASTAALMSAAPSSWVDIIPPLE
jgi:hypothetical protein